jgi:predicted permease
MSAEAAEMAATFAELWSEAADPDNARGRVRTALRAFSALATVAALEWMEFLGVRRAPGRRNRATELGRGGMGFGRNLRFALRTLRKAPAFTGTSVLLVAVGVGAVTTIFTLVDHVLLRPLPYPDQDRLVAVDHGAWQGPLFREVEKMTTVREWAAAWSDQVNLVGSGDPLRLEQARVSEDFFDLFGARAQRGRLLDPADYAAPDVVVLDAGTWQRVWGGDPDVVGRTLDVDGQVVTVVGIMERSFTVPEPLVGRHIDLWRPLNWAVEELNSHEVQVLEVAGRLADGVSVEAAQEEMDALMTRMAAVHRNYTRRDGGPRSAPVVALAEQTVSGVRMGLGLLMGAVALLLLVACANVAHLFLARGLGRTREMAVRRAMGAGTGSLTGQLLVESLVVGLTGGLLGTGLAWLGIRSFVALNPTALPRQASVSLDVPVLAFAVAVSALTSLAFGLLPALRSVRGELADELRGAGRTSTSGRGVALLRNGLVAAEVALSLVLVSGAGLLLRSFVTVRAQETGFDVAQVWTVPLNLQDPETPAEFRETMDEILRQVQLLPGVRSAAYGLTAPMERVGGSRCCWGTTPTVPGHEEGDRSVNTQVHPVTPGYFETLGIEVVAGRTWGEDEGEAEPMPLVVGETYARALEGSVAGVVGMNMDFRGIPATVIGVVRDTRHYGLDQDIGNATYLPMERLPFPIPIGTVIAKVDAAADASMPQALRGAVWAATPSLPVTTVRSMQQAVDRSTAGRRFESLIFGAFASVALLLAAGGLYGTLLYMAGQRKRELGIRLALGASRRRIEASMLRTGLALGLVGVLLGLGGAWMANRLLESRVWGVGHGDPWALGGSAALLLLTAVLASWWPARRAGRVDPLETLRAE